MGKKGIINFLEAIIVIGVLFVAFTVLFPGFSSKSRWPDASTILTSRDLILTMDRLNMIYNNSFDLTELQNFIDTSIPLNRSTLVAWSGIEGTVKSSLVIACNCSGDQIQNLTYWMSGLKINGRDIKINFVPSSLDNIASSDALLIWGNTNLNSFLANFLNYLKNGGGIVEINDFTDSSQTGDVQQKIFGLMYSGGKTFNDRSYADHFSRKPSNSSDIAYGVYKYFYHLAVPLKASAQEISVRVETGMPIPVCSGAIPHGNFTFNDTGYSYWICNSTTVYFDTDNNASADTAVRAGEQFRIFGYNFTLQYIFPYQINVAFGPNYQFQDFLIAWTSPGQACPPGNAWGQYYTDVLTTIDDNPTRIIVNASFTKSQLIDLPVVIINNTGGRAAWIADFANDPNIKNNCLTFSQVSDDEKLLLASLILWASNKQQFLISPVSIKSGLVTQYVNVQNSDTYEVYKFNLGLGSPFGS